MRRLSALPTTIMTKLHRYLWAYRRQFRTGSTQSNTHQARCAAWSANTGGTSSASAQSPTQEGSAMIRHMTWAGSMVLLLMTALYHPVGAAAHGGASGEDDPCLRRVGE